MAPQVAIVTGGGSGIGRAAALALARAGFTVVVAGRRAELLDETVALGSAEGSHIVSITVDVRDPASVDALFARVVETLGRVDLLFNNAGRSLPAGSLVDLSYQDWQAVIETNLTGVFLCAQRAVAQMLAQTPRGGRIINNGSLAAHTPRAHSAPYTASKHAVTGLTKSIALDYRGFDIACGQIDIGNAGTDLAQDLVGRGAIQADGRTEIEPLIDVGHVAAAVVYMAQLPLEANVLFMTVMANKMPFVGRG